MSDDWWAEAAAAQQAQSKAESQAEEKERRKAEAKERERERIREYAKKIAADAPPLTDWQRAHLAMLLRPPRKG